MRRSLSCSLFSLPALAGDFNLGPGGGSGPIIIHNCPPIEDLNHDGVCDDLDKIPPGGITPTNPAGGSINPDPDDFGGVIRHASNMTDRVSVSVLDRADESGAHYVVALMYAPTSKYNRCAVEAADLNGDGWADLVVGDPDNGAMVRGGGAVHVFYGPFSSEESLTLRDADATIYGTVEDGALGTSIYAAKGLGGMALLLNGPAGLNYIVDAERPPERVTRDRKSVV